MAERKLVDGAFYWVRACRYRDHDEKERDLIGLYEATGDHGHPGWLLPGQDGHVEVEPEKIGPCLGRQLGQVAAIQVREGQFIRATLARRERTTEVGSQEEDKESEFQQFLTATLTEAGKMAGASYEEMTADMEATEQSADFSAAAERVAPERDQASTTTVIMPKADAAPYLGRRMVLHGRQGTIADYRPTADTGKIAGSMEPAEPIIARRFTELHTVISLGASRSRLMIKRDISSYDLARLSEFLFAVAQGAVRDDPTEWLAERNLLRHFEPT